MLVKLGNEMEGVVPQSLLRMRIRGQKQFKGEAGAENFRAGLLELVNAGYIRKAPETHYEGPGRRGDGSWEVRDVLLKKPVSEAAAEPQAAGVNLTPTGEPGILTDPLAFRYDPTMVEQALPF